jgi:hypothetical protein
MIRVELKKFSVFRSGVNEYIGVVQDLILESSIREILGDEFGLNVIRLVVSIDE